MKRPAREAGVPEDAPRWPARSRETLRRVLQQARVAGHEGGRGEAEHLPEREVPGHDREHDARAGAKATKLREASVATVSGARNPPACLARSSRRPRRTSPLRPALGHGLAHLHGHEPGEVVLALAQQGARAAHGPAPLREGHPPPFLEGTLRVGDRALDLRGRCLVVGLDLRAGRGVDGFERHGLPMLVQAPLPARAGCGRGGLRMLSSRQVSALEKGRVSWQGRKDATIPGAGVRFPPTLLGPETSGWEGAWHRRCSSNGVARARTSSMICPSCKAENDPSAEACFTCGRALARAHPGLGDRAPLRDPEPARQGRHGHRLQGARPHARRDGRHQGAAPRARAHARDGPALPLRDQAGAQGPHRNVCRIHEYGEDGPLRYISMEYHRGRGPEAGAARPRRAADRGGVRGRDPGRRGPAGDPRRRASSTATSRPPNIDARRARASCG